MTEDDLRREHLENFHWILILLFDRLMTLHECVKFSRTQRNGKITL